MRLWLSFLLLLPACMPPLPLVSDADRAWARLAFPETTDDLAESRGLYVAKCSACHMLVLPRNVPQADWPKLIDKMAPKAKIDDAQHARILRYVLTASRPGQVAGP